MLNPCAGTCAASRAGVFHLMYPHLSVRNRNSYESFEQLGGHAVKAGFKGLTGIGAGAGNGKRFTFPRRGFSSNVPTIIGEEPVFLLSTQPERRYAVVHHETSARGCSLDYFQRYL